MFKRIKAWFHLSDEEAEWLTVLYLHRQTWGGKHEPS